MLVDEASIGYNAYSILKTGKDEFGNKYPLSFKSFGDYKPPAYVYASIIPIKFLGLNSFAVRLISIISGTALIIAIYFLIKQLTSSYYLSLVGALITAVSPWTIILSRFAWESNLALLLFTLALLSFVIGFSSKRLVSYIFAGIFLALTIYCYQTYRFVSITVIALFFFYLFIKKQRKESFVLIISFIIISIPLLSTFLSVNNLNRFKQTSIFTNPNLAMAVNENRTYCMTDQPRIVCYLNSNKLIEYARIISSNYLSTFSIKYLFLSGENEKYLSVDNFGLLPFFLIPFYLLGWVAVLRKGKKNKLANNFVLFCLFVTVLPSAITGDPQRIRLSPLFPFILILIIYGISFAKEKVRRIDILIIGLLIIFLPIYMFNYFNIHVKKYLGDWDYVEKMMVLINKQVEENKIVYLKPFFSEQLIYYVFYSKTDPHYYQQNIQLGKMDEFGSQHAIKLGNIVITDESPYVLACSNKLSSNMIYLTNERTDVQRFKVSPIYEIKTNNNLVTKIYAYNLIDLAPSSKDCNDINNDHGKN